MFGRRRREQISSFLARFAARVSELFRFFFCSENAKTEGIASSLSVNVLGAPVNSAFKSLTKHSSSK